MRLARENDMPADNAPIGIFDSGVGGLSVLREIRIQLPFESVLYFADQGHVPYGPRTVRGSADVFGKDYPDFTWTGGKINCGSL